MGSPHFRRAERLLAQGDPIDDQHEPDRIPSAARTWQLGVVMRQGRLRITFVQRDIRENVGWMREIAGRRLATRPAAMPARDRACGKSPRTQAARAATPTADTNSGWSWSAESTTRYTQRAAW